MTAVDEFDDTVVKVCGICNDSRGGDRPDPCLGTLPGVDFACCGHGTQHGYIAFSNGTRVDLPLICGPRCQHRPMPPDRRTDDTLEGILSDGEWWLGRPACHCIDTDLIIHRVSA